MESVAETLLHQFKHPQGCTCQKNNLNFLGERKDWWTNGKKTINIPNNFVARG